mgnify:FL=1|tara:strand:- start:538 stop:1062 length:525 start_codon:yes stop_codon:yes gene_type:complete
MKSNKNVVLVGMMGSGKTTIGKLLAKKLNLSFVDIDNEIENKFKMKISEIFKNNGEIFFRNVEEKMTLEHLDKFDSIISLGGGGFLNEKIRKKSLKKAITIWLSWSHKTLIDRIKKNKKRPLIMNLNNEQIRNLIINRSSTYSKSKYKIYCERKNKIQIVKEIRKIYETCTTKN